MNNLIIGKTSQLSYYFPENYERIPSRNIDLESFKDKLYNRVYICFSEQRTFITNNKNIFIDTNVNYTLKILDFFTKIANKVIIYGTSELWNGYQGPVSINLSFKYNYSDYIYSKELMINNIKSKNYNNVIILHPFNFNSIYRKSGFLFSKIFDSIINNKKITIGNTYFYRDLIHPKYVVERSILAESDELVGSGRLTFVNDFIRELYSYFSLTYDDFVVEDKNLNNKPNIFYMDSKDNKYQTLFNDTVRDIEKYKDTYDR